MPDRIPVAVAGVTGVAGQQVLAALVDHPWFEVVRLAASERSAGRTLGQALDGGTRWYVREPLAKSHAALPIEDVAAMSPSGLGLVFAAIESEAARALEPRLAAEVPVVSTAAAHRMEPDVPILLPGVNAGHAALLRAQRLRRGGRGFLVTTPNCTAVGLVASLAPLAEAFGLRRVLMTSLQACSGAGRSPGVAALDILDNVIPWIPREEEKVEAETGKILGRLAGDRIEPARWPVSCTCTRVPVMDGHTEAVHASLGRPAGLDEIRAAWAGAGAELARLGLPSAPRRFLVVRSEPDRPQPRLDRDEQGGMAVVVGRLRPDPALEDGVKFVVLSHNTRLGAGGGAVLAAESLRASGWL